MIRKSRDKFISDVRSRVLSEKELHKTRMSSWKSRISTQVSAVKQASEYNSKAIARNERLEEAKKRDLADGVRKQHQRTADQRKSLE